MVANVPQAGNEETALRESLVAKEIPRALGWPECRRKPYRHCLAPAARVILACLRQAGLPFAAVARMSSFSRSLILALLLIAPLAVSSRAAQRPAAPEEVTILADAQQKEKERYLLQGHVEIHYRGMKLTADEATYNEQTQQATARGHVTFEREDTFLEATEADYNLATGRGRFRNVKGRWKAQPPRRRDVLISPNPFFFEGREVERLDEETYVVQDGWVTNCVLPRPKWTFQARRATIRLNHAAVLHHSVFKLFGVPAVYFPLARLSLEREPRKTGFLTPTVGANSRKGTILGLAAFFALGPHADLTAGSQYFSSRGFTQEALFRAKPSADSNVRAEYFGVRDRLRGAANQGGHIFHLLAWDDNLGSGFRAVADVTQLSSQIFRLAYTTTFNEAIVSEVHARAFLSNSFGPYRFNFLASRYENFLTARPQTSVIIRNIPSFQFSGVEQQVGRWPIYFGFDTALEGVSREEPRFKTPTMTQRFDVSPRIVIPLTLFRDFHLTPTFAVRATRYSAQEQDGRIVTRPLARFTEEISLDLRPPALQRIYSTPNGWLGEKLKHVVEARATYRYVNGVRGFSRFIRFDEQDILTDTSEIEYSLTNRLLAKRKDGQVREWLVWRVAQKYYFDPTFRGALVPGQRNVFTALNSLSAFAFADTPRRFSPITSVVKINPGGPFDTELRMDWDTVKHRLANLSLVANARYKQAFASVSEFATRNDDRLQPRSDQIRFLAGYGSLTRRGLNAAIAFTYDIRQNFLSNTVTQASYNADCCGIAFEYRRLALGPERSENQFRISFSIANVGTFGTLRRQERVF